MPLNRDEATYALIGDRVSLSVLPYRDLFDNKQPLIFAAYWLLAQVAPLQLTAVRLAAALVAAAAALLLLETLRRRIGPWRAAAAAGTAVVCGATIYVEGYDFNADHLLVLTGALAVLAPLALAGRRERWIPAAAGVLTGVAILTKAVFVFSVPAVLAALLAGRAARGESVRSTVAWLAAGTAAPMALAYGFFALLGAGEAFWWANVSYNIDYVAGGERLLEPVTRAWPVLLLAAAGLGAGLLRVVRLRGRDALGVTLLLWLAGALAGGFVGGNGFPHYFAPCVIPAAALLWLPVPELPRAAVAALACVAVAVTAPFAYEAARAFGQDARELSARQYGDGFATLWGMQWRLSQELRGHARPGDRLYVAGAEPGFYWASRLRPATRYVYDYPRDISSDWHETIRQDVCARPPRFVVLAWGELPPGCLDGTRYGTLAERDVPGGRVTVLARP